MWCVLLWLLLLLVCCCCRWAAQATEMSTKCSHNIPRADRLSCPVCWLLNQIFLLQLGRSGCMPYWKTKSCADSGLLLVHCSCCCRRWAAQATTMLTMCSQHASWGDCSGGRTTFLCMCVDLYMPHTEPACKHGQLQQNSAEQRHAHVQHYLYCLQSCSA
jgi:hypothetical protein